MFTRRRKTKQNTSNICSQDEEKQNKILATYVHKTKKNKTKYNTIGVGHHY